MRFVQSMSCFLTIRSFRVLISVGRGHIEFDINGFFEPYVRQWLMNTDSKTGQWVEAVSAMRVALIAPQC